MPDARTAHGFSIVEVLVAAGLLATALVALGHLLILAGQASRTARSQSIAVLLAVAKLEELTGDMRAGAGVPAAGTDRIDGSGRTFDDRARTSSAPTYVRRWSIVSLPHDTSLLRLEVVVGPWPWLGDEERPRMAGAVAFTALGARRAP
jgi:hypothetical protein